MKNIWLLIMLMGIIVQLKAQQLPGTLTPLKNTERFLQRYLNIKPDNNLFKLAPTPPKTNKPLTVVPEIKQLMTSEMAYNMPVIKPQVTDKMPVAKPWDANVHYTMQIQGYGNDKTDSVLKVPNP